MISKITIIWPLLIKSVSPPAVANASQLTAQEWVWLPIELFAAGDMPQLDRPGKSTCVYNTLSHLLVLP